MNVDDGYDGSFPRKREKFIGNKSIVNGLVRQAVAQRRIRHQLVQRTYLLVIYDQYSVASSINSLPSVETIALLRQYRNRVIGVYLCGRNRVRFLS